MSKRTKETPAEKLGYRWMMKCLRALDAKPRKLARMRDAIATPDHLHIVVDHADAGTYPGGWSAYRKALRAAAKEALALLHAGSMAAGFRFVKPGDVETLAAPYPRAFKVVITIRRF